MQSKEYRQFAWYPSFSEAIDKLPNEKDREAFTLAIVRYGACGIEPNLKYPLDAVFVSIRKDIDNYIEQRKDGKKGGRPPKSKTDPTKE